MPDVAENHTRSPRARPAVGGPLVLLLALLVAETVLLRGVFNVRVLKEATGWWSGLLAGPSGPARVLIAFLAAALILTGTRLPAHVRAFLDSAADHQRRKIWLAGHFACFAAMFAVAMHIARQPASAGPAHDSFGMAGAVFATAALIFWIASSASPRFWLHLVTTERGAFLSACAVACAAWYAGEWTQKSWGWMNDWTLRLVERLLRLVDSNVMTVPEEQVIGLPQFTARVGAECSGYEGIGLVCVFLATFFWSFRERLRFPAVWILWPIGIVAVWLGNSLRIAALVLIGAHYSPGVALRGFHSQAGWLFFIAVALGLMVTALKLPAFVRQRAPAAPRPQATPVGAYLIPLLVLVGMNMLVASLSDGFERLYPLKFVVTAGVLWSYRAEYRKLDWTWSWGGPIIGAIVFVLWIVLVGAPDEDSEIPLALEQLSPLEARLWLMLRTAGATLTVPFAEELAFRGYLMRRFVSADFDQVTYERVPLWSVGASSLLFGLMHGQWLAGTVAGLFYAYVPRRRGRLCDAIFAHAVTNALIAADVLLTGAWWLW